MDQYDVSVTACEDYDEERVENALRAVLQPVGGLDFVKAGMTVAIKANLVTAMKPESAATPHPAVVCALVRLLRERGAEVIIGDSPGGLYTAAYLKVVYDVSGMRKAEEYGAKMNEDFSQTDIAYPEAVRAKTFPYTAWLTKADAVIDLCKLKTHGMMGMSAAVKNTFGVVPGTKKPEFHYRYPRTEDFADMLVDLYEYVKPRLCICDAVIGMEGNGPTQGSPRKIGCLLASTSGHHLDALAAGLIGLRPQDIPTIQAAVRRGLTPGDPSKLKVFGDPARFTVSDYQTVPLKSSVFYQVLGDGIPGKIADFFGSRILTPFPKLDAGSCIGCAKCAKICPAKAITMKKQKPRIDRSICIHCFCCQEFCPKGAMKVERHFLMKVLGK